MHRLQVAPLLLAAACGGAASHPRTVVPDVAPQDGNSFAVRDVRVFDGERAIEHANVVVRHGLVAQLSSGPLPDDLPIVNGVGRTLIPGLIDAHAHVQSERGLREAVRFGVTTDLDMLTDVTFAQTHRAQRNGVLQTDRCDLWSAGAPVTSPGGMGTQFGFGFPTLGAGDQATEFVDARLREGSDYIKIMYEPDAGIVTTISDTMMAAAVVEAHAQGVLAVVHITTLVGARAAVSADVDGLAHVFGDQPIDDALLAKMHAKHTFVTSTLMAFAFLGGHGLGPSLAADPRISPFLDAKQKVELARAGMPASSPMGVYLDRFDLSTASKNLRRMKDAGIVVLAGDDGSNFGSTGVSMHGELTLLVAAGFTPAEALNAATLAPANAFHLPDRGRIATGARADLILVDGNPLLDITATRAIVKVWKNGYDVPRTLR